MGQIKNSYVLLLLLPLLLLLSLNKLPCFSHQYNKLIIKNVV